MNKPAYQVSLRVKKKMDKAVRSASASEMNVIKKGATLSRRPAKKRAKKVSKRTSPGAVGTRDSSPHYIHIEGERWMKTLGKQTRAKRVVAQKQSLKQK